MSFSVPYFLRQSFLVYWPNHNRMTKVSDAYSFEELCGLTDEDVNNLLRFYMSGSVPALDILFSMRGNSDLSKIDVFDGSFGFSVGV